MDNHEAFRGHVSYVKKGGGVIEINNIDLQPSNQQYQTVRKINKHRMADFVTKLSNESWDTVFDSSDIDSTFNCFLNAYLKIFYSSLPLKRVKNETKGKTCITVGIKTSCKRKRHIWPVGTVMTQD
jgi:hypothetical protein